MSSGNWKELFDAACEGNMDLVRYHVAAGVDLNHVHPEYFGTILVASIVEKREEAARYLLAHGADPHLYSEIDGATPLQAAQRVGLPELERHLRALGASAPSPQAAPAEKPLWCR